MYSETKKKTDFLSNIIDDCFKEVPEKLDNSQDKLKKVYTDLVFNGGYQRMELLFAQKEKLD
jgi:hypothetical protein